MRRMLMPSTLFLAVVVGLVSVSQGQTDVPQPEVQASYYGEAAPMHPDLFYNYYPNTAVGINSAEMYPSPIPTPPVVGHTYYTYEALLPHEHMYSHKRVYYNYYGQGQFYTPQCSMNGGACGPGCPGGNCGMSNGNGGYGINKTTVVWQHSPFSWLDKGGIHHVGMGFRHASLGGMGLCKGLLGGCGLGKCSGGNCRGGLGSRCMGGNCHAGGCQNGNCGSGHCTNCSH